MSHRQFLYMIAHHARRSFTPSVLSTQSGLPHLLFWGSFLSSQYEIRYVSSAKRFLLASFICSLGSSFAPFTGWRSLRPPRPRQRAKPFGIRNIFYMLPYFAHSQWPTKGSMGPLPHFDKSLLFKRVLRGISKIDTMFK